MKKQYDFSKAKRNPYAKRLKKQITIRLDKGTLEYFKGLAEDKKHTIILSTHILQEVSMICKRVLIINEGRLAADDTFDNLTSDGSLEEVFLKVTATD